MDFPFSLNVEKQFPPLSLPGGRVSEFFLNSINSLSDPVNMDSGLVASLEGVAEKVATPEDGGGGSGEKEGANAAGKEGEGIKIAAGIEGGNKPDEPREEGASAACGGNDKEGSGGEEPTNPKVKGKGQLESNAHMYQHYIALMDTLGLLRLFLMHSPH